MSKYLETKKGSIESAVLEAMSPAQQAAIAISKKEKGEKPKKEKDEGNAFGAALAAAKEKGDDTFVVAGKKYDVKTEQEVKEFVQADGAKKRVKEGDNRLKANKTETNKNDKSDDGEGLDAVQPKAVKKKFDDRKDKDIDNDGDVDSSDKFLHKKRKAISKSMDKEKKEVKEETLAMKAAKHIASMWEDSAKAKEAKVKEEEEEPKKKESKTAMTGKPMAGVEVNPKESKDK